MGGFWGQNRCTSPDSVLNIVEIVMEEHLEQSASARVGESIALAGVIAGTHRPWSWPPRYLFPRTDHVVIGGTFEVGVNDETADKAVCQGLVDHMNSGSSGDELRGALRQSHTFWV